VTKDEKQLLKAIGMFVGFKILLYASINYASRCARKAVANCS
jgi:hypothetical protein